MRPDLSLLTESHRIAEWRGLTGNSGDHLDQPPAKAGSPAASCTEPHPGGF